MATEEKQTSLSCQGVFTLGDAQSPFWADVKNSVTGFNVKF